MKIVITLCVVIGIVYIIIKYLEYRREVGKSEGYAKRRIIYLLFAGFTTMVGIFSSISSAIYELLGLSKPHHLDWISFAAFGVLCVSSILIMRSGVRKNKIYEKRTSQKHSGIGDNIGGDKIINSK